MSIASFSGRIYYPQAENEAFNENTPKPLNHSYETESDIKVSTTQKKEAAAASSSAAIAATETDSLSTDKWIAQQQLWQILENPKPLSEELILEFSALLNKVEFPFEVDSVRNTSLLYTAAKKGAIAIVQAIIRHDSILNEAAFAWDSIDQKEYVRVFSDNLLSHKTQRIPLDLDAKIGNQQMTALQVACQEGHAEVVELLLDAGASLAGDVPPLWIASSMGRLNVIQVLIQYTYENTIHLDLDAKVGTYQTTALHIACRGGHATVVEALVNAGASVESRTTDDVTPLFLAAHCGKAEVVQVLIRSAHQNKINLNLNAKSNTTQLTALLEACWQGYVDVVKVLIEEGASTEARTLTGSSPLWLASVNGKPEVVKMLIRYAADNKINLNINERKAFDLSTALHGACEEGFEDVVEVLLQAGASINIRDSNGHTPLFLAKNHEDVQRKIFFPLTGGEGNTDQFLDETEKNFSSLLNKLERSEPIDDFEDFFEAVQVERRIHKAISMGVSGFSQRRSIESFAKLFFCRQLYDQISLQADLISGWLDQQHIQRDQLMDICKVSRYFDSKILKLFSCIEECFERTVLAGEFLQKLGPIQGQFRNIVQRASSKAASLSVAKLTAYQQKFDSEELFILLSAWKLGVGQDYFLGDDDYFSENSEDSQQPIIKITPLESYLNELNLQLFTDINSFADVNRVFSNVGLFEGRDLRAVGIDLDIEFYCAQLENGKGDPRLVIEQMKLLLEDKQGIWCGVLGEQFTDSGIISRSFSQLEADNYNHDSIALFNTMIIKLYKDNGLALLTRFLESRDMIQTELKRHNQESLGDYQSLKNYHPLEVHQELSIFGVGRSDSGAKRQRR